MPARARFASPALILFALLAGCSDSTGGNNNNNPPPDPCEEMASMCVAKQQGCVADGETARCEPCAAGQYAALSGKCEAIEGKATSHDFSEFTTMPGEEVLGLCQSWTMNNAEELWVNTVVLDQDVASHHSNWTYVPDDQYQGPDGVWPCKERLYSQLDAALVGGVLYAQSTQATHEVQKFPKGTAVRIPPYSRIIGDVHLLNTGSTPVTGHAKLTIHSLPAADVKVKLVPFHLSYDGLDIPPQSASRFTGNCAVATQFPGGVLDLKVYYILPHTHALATRFFVDVLGGPDDKKNLIEVKGFTSEAHGLAYDPPIDMSKAQGFSFGCEYFNPGSQSVGWGYGDQEMCELLGFADATRAFESRIDDANPDGTNGTTQLFTGACSTLAFPWDHKKPGGPGPQ